MAPPRDNGQAGQANAAQTSALKMDIPKFTGKNGPIQCQSWISHLEALKEANQISDESMLHIARTSLTQDSPAWTFHFNESIMNKDAVGTWKNFIKAFREEFCRPLSLDQLQMAEQKLAKVQSETVSDF